MTARLAQFQTRNVIKDQPATPEVIPAQDLEWPEFELPIEQTPLARSSYLDDFKLDAHRLSRG